MEFKGRISDISRDWISKKFKITFECDSDITQGIDALSKKDLRIRAVQWKEKRSLDANAYYWALLTRLAGAMHISNAYAHNIMLRQYGQPELSSGTKFYVMVPDTDEAAKTADESQTFHLHPTSNVRAGKDGLNFRAYWIIRGSSTYDTKEMSRLIDGLIKECRENGIETDPPDVIERYKQEWGMNIG